MNTLHHHGYFPLNERSIRSNASLSPGIYILAVLDEGGSYRNFYATYSDNVLSSLLRQFHNGVNIPGGEGGRQSKCYFAFVAVEKEAGHEQSVGKLLMNTSDPVRTLEITVSN